MHSGMYMYPGELPEVQSSIRVEKKRDLGDFERRLVVAVRWDVWTKTPCWCERPEENGPIPGDKKATVTEIITGYNKGVQNIIFQYVTGWTLKMSYSSRKVRLQLEPELNNRRLENHCLVWQVLISAEIFRWSGENLAQTRWRYGSKLPCVDGSAWCWWCNGGVGDIFDTLWSRYSQLSILQTPQRTRVPLLTVSIP